jgi:hypothetical protein
MRGGEEDPCLGEELLQEFQRTQQRPCPRVDLAPQNLAAADLVRFALDERLRAHGPELLRISTGWMGDEERLALLLRVAQVLGRKDVHDALHPELKKKDERR